MNIKERNIRKILSLNKKYEPKKEHEKNKYEENPEPEKEYEKNKSEILIQKKKKIVKKKDA